MHVQPAQNKMFKRGKNFSHRENGLLSSCAHGSRLKSDSYFIEDRKIETDYNRLQKCVPMLQSPIQGHTHGTLSLSLSLSLGMGRWGDGAKGRIGSLHVPLRPMEILRISNCPLCGV